MLRGVFLISMLVYLEVSTILEVFWKFGLYKQAQHKRLFSLVRVSEKKIPHILGDDNSPLFPWIMTPHKEDKQHSMFELLYNKKHKCGCSIVNF
jgi:hypothetical protein